jgi:hypothetical protein
MSFALAAFFKPLAFLIVLGLICLPVRYAVIKWFPEGKIKRLLLFKVSEETPGNPARKTPRSNSR